MNGKNHSETPIEELKRLLVELRDPKTGCPWFRRQTHASLKPECVEEAAEVLCGVDVFEKTGQSDNLKEELGDLLLQVVFHAQIAAEEGLFTFDDVARAASEKLVRRHPYVFAGEKYDSYDALVARYREIKRQEKAGKEWIERDFLPRAFEEARALVDVAIDRKKRDRDALDQTTPRNPE
ncbi:MAG: hypothetical protein IJL92_10860 [Thermoguttaceae bacterium]|nr:hypothetical protein [Thermoguttaceae bacterium]